MLQWPNSALPDMDKYCPRQSHRLYPTMTKFSVTRSGQVLTKAVTGCTLQWPNSALPDVDKYILTTAVVVAKFGECFEISAKLSMWPSRQLACLCNLLKFYPRCSVFWCRILILIRRRREEANIINSMVVVLGVGGGLEGGKEWGGGCGGVDG